MVSWSWNISTKSTYELLLALTLEEYAADEDWVQLRLERLRAETHIEIQRIKVAANGLWALGHLAVEELDEGATYRWFLRKVALVPSPPQTPPFLGVFTFGKNSPPRAREAEPGTAAALAHSLTVGWFGQTPAPTCSFVAGLGLVKRLVEAGHPEADIEKMLRTNPVPSMNWMLAELKRLQPRVVEPRLIGPPPAPQKLRCEGCGATGTIRSEGRLVCLGCGLPW
jgi:hypothetical protein